MAVALTVTPALGLLLLRRSDGIRRESPLKIVLVRWYSRALERITTTARPAYLAVAGLAILAVAATPQLGQSLLPEFKERDLLMHWITRPGTSLQDEVRITTLSAHELGAIPGVRNFGAHIGQASNADEVVGPEFGENWISIDPEADYDQTLAAVQDEVDSYPGLYRDVQTYLKERIREVLTGTDEALVVRISGDDLETLAKLADEIEDVLSATPGLEAPQAELLTDVPQIEVKVDLDRAQRYGLKPGDVRRAAATLVAGIEVADVYQAGRTYDINVYGVPALRHSLASIQAIAHRHPGRSTGPARPRRRRGGQTDTKRDPEGGRHPPDRRDRWLDRGGRWRDRRGGGESGRRGRPPSGILGRRARRACRA